MGQKTNPIGNRLGIIRGWDSMWLGDKKQFADKVYSDWQIRQYIQKRFPRAGVSRIIIERFPKRISITIFTSRPGVIVGKGGREINMLTEELKALTGEEVDVKVGEINRPELEAPLVAETIARQIEARVNHRRAVKAAINTTMRMGAEGIKVHVSGRLGGAEIARTEKYMDGRVPLSTLRADIDYALKEAFTKWGVIGVKVWICRGEVYGKRDLSIPAPAAVQQKALKRRTYNRPVKK